MHELREAWSDETDLAAELAELDSCASVLAEVVALTSQRDAIVPPLKEASQQAQLAAASAMQHAEQLEAEVASYAADLTQVLQHDWDQQRPGATRAAHAVHAGNGRLGHRWAAVRSANEELGRWSTCWQPYLPAMPTRTEDIVRFASGPDNPLRIREAFERYARGVAEQARPEFAAAQADAAAAAARRDEAWRACHEASSRYILHLSRYGSMANIEDPAGYRRNVESAAAEARTELASVRARLEALLTEPALRALPPDRINDQRAVWSVERHAAQQAIYRRSAQLDADARIPSIKPEPWTPAGPQPSRGISR